MEPTTVRLVLIEGENADGVTVEYDAFEVADESNPADQVISAIVGTREGAVVGGYQLTSTGVTWTDAAAVAALRDQLAARDLGSVMLVSPLLAAAALAQTVGSAIGYEYIAMLLVEPASATLVVVDVADGSIVDLHRHALTSALTSSASPRSRHRVAAELAAMVAGLDARRSRADGLFVVGCGADVAAIKPALEAATSLAVSVVEEPEMALARGAALASANAPLFASSTAALAYALDPGTGEVNPSALSPTYLDAWANADSGVQALAYSALGDEDESWRRRRPVLLAGSGLAAIFVVAVGALAVWLTSHVRPAAASHPPAPTAPPAASSPPAAPPSSPPAAPPSAVAAPPAPPPVVEQAPTTTPKPAPATPLRRAPTPRAPAPVQQTPAQQAPVQQAAPTPVVPAPSPPAAVPAPAPQPAAPAVPAQPPMTMYLHVPFVTIPIPITPPQPAAPPAAPPAP